MSPTREQGWARQGPSGQDRQDRRDVGIICPSNNGPFVLRGKRAVESRQMYSAREAIAIISPTTNP